jgi:hypothetical protein
MGRFAGVLLLSASAIVVCPAVASPARAARRPNVLVFVSDDQTRATVTPEIMPTVYRDMITQGVSYPAFTDATPICCPSAPRPSSPA